MVVHFARPPKTTHENMPGSPAGGAFFAGTGLRLGIGRRPIHYHRANTISGAVVNTVNYLRSPFCGSQAGTAHPVQIFKRSVARSRPCSVPKLCTTIGIPSHMPNTNNPLPIVCPACQYDGCMLVVRSRTVIMVKCVRCRHEWATDFDNLTPEIQQKVDEVLQDH